MRLSAANPMGRSLIASLICEGLVFALAIPGMIWVAGVSTPLAIAAGAGAAVLALLAAATLRTPAGYPLAWLTQAAALALGLLTPWMFAVGGVFVLLWVISFVLGQRLDAR